LVSVCSVVTYTEKSEQCFTFGTEGTDVEENVHRRQRLMAARCRISAMQDVPILSVIHCKKPGIAV
jgi:hypothetical protein